MKTLTRVLISILVVILIGAYLDFIDDSPMPPITAADLETAARQPGLRREGVPGDWRGTGARQKIRVLPRGFRFKENSRHFGTDHVPIVV